jgi:hypothetical protein
MESIMGEIKSTLDLVMEKTRHLSMSEDEKKAQQQEETRKVLRGFILKYRDQILQQEQFEKELNRLSDLNGIDPRPLLVAELLDDIDPGQDNTALITLLKNVCGIDVDPLESILNEYGARVTLVKDERVAEIKAQFLKTRGISGSAVVPNLESDTDWVARTGSVKDAYRKRLGREIEKYYT